MKSKVPVVCADVGSVQKGRFGWWDSRFDDPSREGVRDITKFADAATNAVKTYGGVAIGFECPLFIPAPDQLDPGAVTSRRKVDGNHPWSAGAGVAALATGLAESRWVFARMGATLGATRPQVFFDWSAFQSANCKGIFVWEAFVAGGGKARTGDGMPRPTADEDGHWCDARLAVHAFRSKVQMALTPMFEPLEPEPVTSLAALALMSAGWAEAARLVNFQCRVLKVRQPEESGQA